MQVWFCVVGGGALMICDVSMMNIVIKCENLVWDRGGGV